MKERPILFSAPMVRAVLDGRKTQTRRIVKWQGPKGYPHSFEHAEVDNPAGVKRLCVPFNHPSQPDSPWWEHGAHRHYCPYGEPPIQDVPADRLWVRETGWERPERTTKMMREGADTWERYYYDADGYDNHNDVAQFKEWGFKRRPAIHMPRWASRITLEITGVRIERLQEISEADAIAEGVTLDESCEAKWGVKHDPRMAYADLWESINGPGSWDANPWIFVIDFKRVIEIANA